jgi:hypothetical protein
MLAPVDLASDAPGGMRLAVTTIRSRYRTTYVSFPVPVSAYRGSAALPAPSMTFVHAVVRSHTVSVSGPIEAFTTSRVCTARRHL